MLRDSLAMEHYRMHTMEQWPESPRKAAGLAAVRSTIEALEKTAPGGTPDFVCAECLCGHSSANIVVLPISPLLPIRERAAA